MTDAQFKKLYYAREFILGIQFSPIHVTDPKVDGSFWDNVVTHAENLQAVIEEVAPGYLARRNAEFDVLRLRKEAGEDVLAELDAWVARGGVRGPTHYPPGMGEESRRLHREYNALVDAQRAGAKNGADVVRLTDECAAKGIVLVPGGETL